MLVLSVLVAANVFAQDDVSDLLNNAKSVTTAPAPVTSPDAPNFRPPGPAATRAPEGSRDATILLSDGTRLQGSAWTTLETPMRVWVEEDKRYHDVDLALVSRIDVHVLKEGMEDDWRWLKEGSDQKVYSGKKYPNVELAYRLTLVNGQVIEGGIVAPIYVRTAGAERPRTLALYKKFKGNLDQTLKDVVYIKQVVFSPPAEAAATPASAFTRKLPLLPD